MILRIVQVGMITLLVNLKIKHLKQPKNIKKRKDCEKIEF